MNRLVWVGCFSYLLIGFAHVAAGSVLRMLLQHYDFGYDQGGLLIFLQFAGLMVGVLTAPWWTRWFGRRGALTLALICLTVAETVMFFLPPWTILLILAPVAGFGFGMIETVVSALVIEGAVEGGKAKAFSRVEVFFGLGALIMPLLSIVFISAGWWRFNFATVAVFSLIMLFVWNSIDFGQKIEGLMRKKVEVLEVLEVLEVQGQTLAAKPPAALFKGVSFVLLLIFIAIFAAYVGIEMSLANFLPSIMVESNKTNEATALFSASLLWIGVSIGRLYAGVLAEKIKYANYLMWHTLAAVLLLVGFLFTDHIWSSFILVFLLGLALSGMFSIALVFADKLLPGRTEQMTSLLIASGGIGGALLPLFSGWSLKNYSVDSTLIVLVGMLLLMLCLFAIASRFKESKG